jgi:hypothetical protein
MFSLILSFRYSWSICWFHVLHCSDYTNLFHLDPVTTAIQLVSLDLIILSILCGTMAYGSSIQNKTGCKCRKKNSPSGIYGNVAILFPGEVLHTGFLLGLYSTLKMEVICVSETSFTYTLHGVMSQKMATWLQMVVNWMNEVSTRIQFFLFRLHTRSNYPNQLNYCEL